MSSIEETTTQQVDHNPTLQPAATTTQKHCKSQSTAASLPLRVLAEFAGVFLVCFATYAISTYVVALAGNGMALLLIAISVAISYGLATILFARYSGAHLNPAVTIAQFLIGKVALLDTVLYIIAQVLGGIAAAALLILSLPISSQLTLKVWMASTGLNTVVNGYGKGSPTHATLQGAGASFTQGTSVLIEVLATVLVVAVAVSTMRITSCRKAIEKSAPKQAFSVGAAYTLATLVAFPVTGASLNPARATGIALFAHGAGLDIEPLSQLWFFWVCALLGGILVSLVVIVTRILHQQFMTPSAAESHNADGETDVDAKADADAKAEESTESVASSTSETIETAETSETAATPSAQSNTPLSDNGSAEIR